LGIDGGGLDDLLGSLFWAIKEDPRIWWFGIMHGQ
jgi:hypothetical protein